MVGRTMVTAGMFPSWGPGKEHGMSEQHEGDRAEVVVVGMGPGSEDVAERLAESGLDVVGGEGKMWGGWGVGGGGRCGGVGGGSPIGGFPPLKNFYPRGRPAGRGPTDPGHGR